MHVSYHDSVSLPGCRSNHHRSVRSDIQRGNLHPTPGREEAVDLEALSMIVDFTSSSQQVDYVNGFTDRTDPVAHWYAERCSQIASCSNYYAGSTSSHFIQSQQ